jgi:hypothetical protein
MGTTDDDLSTRIPYIVLGLAFLLTPVAILTLTLAFLSYTGEFVAGRLTLLELLELYVLDLAVLVGAALLLYYLLGTTIRRQFPLLDEDEEETD